MADTNISALTAASVSAMANELPINEGGTSKKIILTQVQTVLQPYLGSVIAFTHFSISGEALQ